jgi:hypothetical protein
VHPQDLHSNTINNWRLQAPSDGFYLITLQITWEIVNVGFRQMRIDKKDSVGANLVTLGINAIPTVLATWQASQYMTVQTELEAGDQVRARVFQNSGVDVDVILQATSPSFAMVRL